MYKISYILQDTAIFVITFFAEFLYHGRNHRSKDFDHINPDIPHHRCFGEYRETFHHP